MAQNTPHRHDKTKHSKKGKKSFKKMSAKQRVRIFKLWITILEALVELVRLIDRIRNIGG